MRADEWRDDPKNPPRIVQQGLGDEAVSALHQMGFLVRLLTAAVIEHGPITVTNESLGSAGRFDLVWQQTEDGVRVEVGRG